MTQKNLVAAIINYNKEDAEFARATLINWFEQSARTFPWRYDTDPYHILTAEMMLRRTVARQVEGVYCQFLRDYPAIQNLAEAEPEQIRESLRPLGLTWRAANFELLAREIVERHGGRVPEERQELLMLTGVGPYVADAVRIFAFGKTAALADTNTVRVAARYFGFEYDQESRRKPAVVAAVTQLIEPQAVAKSNYALLDFAALICQSRKPLHEACPLAERCTYLRNENAGDQGKANKPGPSTQQKQKGEA